MTFPSVLAGVNVLCYLSYKATSHESLHNLSDSACQSDGCQIEFNFLKREETGADPGFFLGGGALVSSSTSTPINHIIFFCRIPVVLENRRSSHGGGGGGMRTPCTLPLDPPLGDFK